MALKAIVESLDSVPEALHAEYLEKDGKFILAIDGLREHPEALSLKNALDNERKAKRQLQEELKPLKEKFDALGDDFDPEEYRRLKDTDPGKKVDERLQKQREDYERKLQAEVDKREGRIEKLQRSLQKSLVDDRLTKALLDAGVAKEFLGAAKALIKESGAVKLTEDDNGFDVFADDGVNERTPLHEFIGKWTGDEGKIFIPKATGGDARGNNGSTVSGDNPWDSKNPNLTRQELLIRENPARARQLAQAAGVSPDW